MLLPILLQSLPLSLSPAPPFRSHADAALACSNLALVLLMMVSAS